MIEKPPHGSPCNSCGQCCAEQLCPLAEHVFGFEQGPCPALDYDRDKKSRCGLVISPARFAPLQTLRYGAEIMTKGAMVLIGAGIGCDAQLIGEPRDPSFALRLRTYRIQFDADLLDGCLAWGISP